jgi:hypothetical protein
MKGEKPMELFRKAFLFLVGAVIVIAEETGKSIKEATEAIEERREAILGTSTK